MRVLVVEHESDSGIGLLGERLAATGARTDTFTPATGIPRSAAGYDAVISLGSAHSVMRLGASAWFAAEQALLRDAIERQVPILGVCFGAQSLAVALGGAVTRAITPEVGWKMIDSTEASTIAEGPWFQWHEDAITAPPGAEVLATSDICLQAFRCGPHLGVQFHPEAGAQQAADWSDDDPGGLAASGCSRQELVALTEDLLPDARRRAADLWDEFVRGSAAVRRPIGAGMPGATGAR